LDGAMPPHRFYFFIFLVFIILFPLRLYFYQKLHQPLLDAFVNTTIEAQGVVVEEPEEKSFYIELIVKLSGTKRVQKIIVQAPFSPRFEYGDKVHVKGKLKHPKDFKTDAGHIFPYQKYLAKDDIYYILSSPTVTLIQKEQGNAIKAKLFDIKQKFIRQIRKMLPRPESSLMAGMLIAGKDGLGTALEDDFKEVGLIHIVVLSGYNVTIVAEAFIKVLSFLPASIGYGMGAVGIILFALMAGGSTTIIRASIMALIALLGKMTGNIYSALRALIIVAVVMVLWDPLILRYDPSFHLSFMATFALIVFSPVVQSFLGKFGETAVGEIISSTLAVEIFLLPYILYMNGSFAFISFPANLLVLSFLPFTMLVGFLGTMISFISLSLSYPFAIGSFIMLRYILRVAEIATGLTGWGITL
jgi:competence protein ComEC